MKVSLQLGSRLLTTTKHNTQASFVAVVIDMVKIVVRRKVLLFLKINTWGRNTIDHRILRL